VGFPWAVNCPHGDCLGGLAARLSALILPGNAAAEGRVRESWADRSPVRRPFSKVIAVTRAKKDVKDHVFSQGHQPKFEASRRKCGCIHTQQSSGTYTPWGRFECWLPKIVGLFYQTGLQRGDRKSPSSVVPFPCLPLLKRYLFW